MIDWFTVCAQALNFLILVWLLKRFLFKPILAAIDTREKLIAGELADAAGKQAIAEKGRLAFEQKASELDQQRAALLTKAKADAGAERETLLSEARQVADELSAKQRDALAAESKSIADAVSQRARQEVFAIARRTLNDLGGVSVEARIVDVFCRQIRAIAGSAKALLGAALSSGPTPAVVRTALDLSEDGRAMVQKALNETFAAAVPLRFETTSSLIGGIELAANGQKIVWNIEGYLASLEEGVSDVFGHKNIAEPHPKILQPETVGVK